MPNVIDNQKVAETIRKLLKENNMTQEDLANVLSITKSAVSQNLRGKSNFDIQNLIAIAKHFDITLDELLSLKQIENEDDIVTEYKRVVKKGISAINQVPVSELKIADADLYGKVLVEYIIEENALDMFIYLNQNNAMFVSDGYHRAKIIYIKIIKFMLENNLKDVFKYVLKYTKIHGSFMLDNQFEAIIWQLLNMKEHQDTVLQIVSYCKKNSFWDKVMKKDVQIPLSTKDLLTIIAKHRLNHVLETYLETQSSQNDLYKITQIFLVHTYTEGLRQYIEREFDILLNEAKKWVINAQGSTMAVLKAKELNLLKLYLEKELYTNLNSLVVEAAKIEQYDILEYLLEKFEDDFVYINLAEVLVAQRAVDMIKKIVLKLNKNELNKLLMFVQEDDIEMLTLLFSLGARFSTYHFENTQFNKINNLIEKLLEKDKE